MRILFTIWGLTDRRGGSELHTLEVVEELAARGHEVVIYAGEIASLGRDFQKSAGIRVVSDPRDCPWTPDVIHGMHRIHALKALMAFPRTPSLLHTHGFVPVLEKPFLHPRIFRYLVVSRGLIKHWSDGLGIPAEKIEFFPNHVDVRKFHCRGEAPHRPARALLFSNGRFTQDQMALLENVCSAQGMEFEAMGRCVGKQVEHPEHLIPKYDLVFAVGRSALEAAAVGCGVIPVHGDMAEEMILPENYERFRHQNMAIRILHHKKLSEEWVREQLARWNTDHIAEVTKLVRESASLHAAVERLEVIYDEVVRTQKETPRASLEEEIAAIQTMLQKEAAYEAPKKMRMLQNRIKNIESSWSWRLTSPLREITNWHHWVSQATFNKAP